MVTRYGSDGFQPGVIEVECGDLVHYDDYAALQAEIERLKAKTATTIGVGDGSGSAFVHGDYDSIKILQGKLVELERLKTEAGYTAADVATAAADGFRDGVRSVDLEQFHKTIVDAMDFIAHFSWAWNGTGQHPNTIQKELKSLLALIDAHKGE